MGNQDAYLEYLLKKKAKQQKGSLKNRIKTKGISAAKKEAMVEGFLSKETGLLKDILRLSKNKNVGVTIKTIVLLIKKRFGVELAVKDLTPLALYMVARGCTRTSLNGKIVILGCYITPEYRDKNIELFHFRNHTLFIHKSLLSLSRKYNTCPNCGAIKLEKANASSDV